MEGQLQSLALLKSGGRRIQATVVPQSIAPKTDQFLLMASSRIRGNYEKMRTGRSAHSIRVGVALDVLGEFLGPLPDLQRCVRIGWRLLAAGLVGALIGYQRERTGKAAGLRTHILVAMGTALFVIAGVDAEMGSDAISRIIQGLATGIGFLGAGAIMKREQSHEIHGLTTAAGIWMTAALGTTIGLGQIIPGFAGAILAWGVLALLHKLPVERDVPKNQ